tara:strand:+ start:41383 stop:41838 length:456 start_codon:yes stop_codon:yes gene_type:complete
LNSPTLSELFEDSNSDTITHRGKIIRAIVRIPVRDGALVIVERLSVASPRPQAVKFALNSGVMDINGYRGPEVALWSHNSPETNELRIRGAGASLLEVWNAWSMGGVDTSWIGNAGIVTKSTSEGEILQCSDGLDIPSFSDLVVQISIAPE